MSYTIPPGHQNKLQARSTQTILVGYEKNSNSYRLWDPKSNRVIVSNDVIFDEQRFPLRENINSDPSELSVLQDEVWDEMWETPGRSHGSSHVTQPEPSVPDCDTPTQE